MSVLMFISSFVDREKDKIKIVFMEVLPKKKQTHDVTPSKFRELFGCIKF